MTFTIGPGTHTFTLKKAGYADAFLGPFAMTAGSGWSIGTTLNPPSPAIGEFDLDQVPLGVRGGSLTVRLQLGDVDKTVSSGTSFLTAPGTYLLLLSAPGILPYSQLVTITQNQVTKLFPFPVPPPTLLNDIASYVRHFSQEWGLTTIDLANLWIEGGKVAFTAGVTAIATGRVENNFAMINNGIKAIEASVYMTTIGYATLSIGVLIASVSGVPVEDIVKRMGGAWEKSYNECRTQNASGFDCFKIGIGNLLDSAKEFFTTVGFSALLGSFCSHLELACQETP